MPSSGMYMSGRIRATAPPTEAARVRGGRLRATAAPAPAKTADDPFIASLLALPSEAAPALAPLSAHAAAALANVRMPSTRTEQFRYTDIAPLLRQRVTRPPAPPAARDLEAVVRACTLPAADATRLVVVDGVVDASLSTLSGVPASVYLGDLSGAADAVASRLNTQGSARGGVFATLNAATCVAVAVVAVPAGVVVEAPIHVVHVSTGADADGAVCVSSPRLLVCVDEGAGVDIVEEFVSADAARGRYLVNSVAEAFVAKGGSLKHSYVELDAADAFHVKATLVSQAEESRYSLVEARLGGAISRHDLSIEQQGPRTHTDMKHFVLSSEAQLHDLHTQLVLDHPEGVAQQLHKCIASHASSRGVFDGSVQVKRRAQKTDAGQLSRNLLLVPKATVNVKPNLQIVADDVKCTHGCAVSDLRPEELFYFQSRGIDAPTARKALVFSFGAEVMQSLQHKDLVSRLQAVVNSKLEDAA